MVDHLRGDGWRGVRVNAFRGGLRPEWFLPAPRTLAEAGAPRWAVEVFGRLRAANGGTLSGFFDVFAWREPGQVGFYEANVGPDRIKAAQLWFVEAALRLHGLEEFMSVEVSGPLSPSSPAREPGRDRRLERTAVSTWPAPSPGGQGALRRPGQAYCRRSAASPGQISRKRARHSRRGRGHRSTPTARASAVPGSDAAPDRRHHAIYWPPGLRVAHGSQPVSARPRWEMAVPSAKHREGPRRAVMPFPQLPLRVSRASAPTGWSAFLGRMSCRHQPGVSADIERGKRRSRTADALPGPETLTALPRSTESPLTAMSAGWSGGEGHLRGTSRAANRLIRFRNSYMTWSPVTESNRRPSPYHRHQTFSLPAEAAGHNGL